jgi:hypothetical protein
MVTPGEAAQADLDRSVAPHLADDSVLAIASMTRGTHGTSRTRRPPSSRTLSAAVIGRSPRTSPGTGGSPSIGRPRSCGGWDLLGRSDAAIVWRTTAVVLGSVFLDPRGVATTHRTVASYMRGYACS